MAEVTKERMAEIRAAADRAFRGEGGEFARLLHMFSDLLSHVDTVTHQRDAARSEVRRLRDVIVESHG